MAKIIYVHNINKKEVVAEVLIDRRMTVWEALEIAGVNMDEYAESHSWDGYDPNSLILEYL